MAARWRRAKKFSLNLHRNRGRMQCEWCPLPSASVVRKSVGLFHTLSYDFPAGCHLDALQDFFIFYPTPRADCFCFS